MTRVSSSLSQTGPGLPEDSTLHEGAPHSALRSDPLTLTAILTLPLTDALTFDLGFPLKVCEVALALALPLRLSCGSIRNAAGSAGRLSAAFLVAAATSLTLAVTLHRRPADPGIYRFGAVVDGILQVGYLGLAIVAMTLVADIARRRPGPTLRAWFGGAIISSIYIFYVNAGAFLNVEVPLLPGTSFQSAHIGDAVIFRAGTFLEGNFFGVYLLATLVLALCADRFAVALLTSGALILTLSSLSICLALMVWCVWVLAQGTRGRLAPAAVFLVLTLSALVMAMPSAYFSAVISEKLDVKNSQSLVERLGSIQAALAMFSDHPFTGVGLSQYGLWFREYRPDMIPDEFLAEIRRYIPNNVYAQVLGETGLLGAVFFALLLLGLLGATKASRQLRFGLLAVLISFNAFPSLTAIFVWAFFGAVIGLTRRTPVWGAPAP